MTETRQSAWADLGVEPGKVQEPESRLKFVKAEELPAAVYRFAGVRQVEIEGEDKPYWTIVNREGDDLSISESYQLRQVRESGLEPGDFVLMEFKGIEKMKGRKGNVNVWHLEYVKAADVPADRRF